MLIAADGGSAGNGKVVGGRYFVAEKSRLTEFSPEPWTRNYRYGKFTDTASPLGSLIGFGLFALALSSGRKLKLDRASQPDRQV